MDNKLEVSVENKVCGFYKLEAIKVDADGNEISKRVLADWFPNLITNGGLDRMGNFTDWGGYCQVGAGSTTPAFTDTSLVSFIASSNTISATKGTEATSPYYAWNICKFTFGVGVAAGNISEVGVGWSSGAGTLFSRALILDEFEVPTTITVLSDEILNVTYEFRFYPKLTDTTGTCVFTGAIGGSYDWIFRAASCGTTAAWVVPRLVDGVLRKSMGYLGFLYMHDGDIGAITSAPAGAQDQVPGEAQTYVTGEYLRRYTISCTLSDANFAGGARSFRAYVGMGAFQWQFDPAIPKTSDDTLTFVVSVSWGRV